MVNGLQWMRHMILIYSCCMCSLFVLLWIIFPAKSFVAGFVLGELIGLYNVLYIARRVRIAGKQVIAGNHRLPGSGIMVRLLAILLGVGFIYRFPEWVDAKSFVLGLLASYLVMFLIGCLYAKRKRKSLEGGDVLGNHSND